VDASRLKILYKARQQIDIEKRSPLFIFSWPYDKNTNRKAQVTTGRA